MLTLVTSSACPLLVVSVSYLISEAFDQASDINACAAAALLLPGDANLCQHSSLYCPTFDSTEAECQQQPLLVGFRVTQGLIALPGVDNSRAQLVRQRLQLPMTLTIGNDAVGCTNLWLRPAARLLFWQHPVWDLVDLSSQHTDPVGVASQQKLSA